MKFDIIIPMGCYCGSAQSLRTVKKRTCSLPFDWIVPVGLDNAVDFIENKFEGFFDKEDLKRFDYDTKKNIGYINVRNNLRFLHDFKVEADFDKEFPLLKEKYDRRIARLYNLLEKSKNILYLHILDPERINQLPHDEFILKHFDRLRGMYPEKNHRLVFIRLVDKVADVAYNERLIRDDVKYYDCFYDEDVIRDPEVPSYVYYRKNLAQILKNYKVKVNWKNVLKKMFYKIMNALSTLIPNRALKNKARMMYKEYK